MPKRASLDTDQFKVALPPQPRDPLDSLIPTSPPPVTEPGARVNNFEAKSVRPYVRTDGRTPLELPPIKQQRVRIRHPFNIFADQLADLRTLEVERVRAGKKKKTLAAMVTTAIDDYLKKQKKLLNRS